MKGGRNNRNIIYIENIVIHTHTHTHTHEYYSALKREEKAGHWWLTRVILAAQEAEIRRIVVQFEASLGK
jgi:hypothetical protein